MRAAPLLAAAAAWPFVEPLLPVLRRVRVPVLDAGSPPEKILGQLGWLVRSKFPQLAPAGLRPSIEAVFKTDLDLKRSAGDPRALLERLVVGVGSASHPRDLSEGQRLALVLAVQLTAAPDVVLLDEPTRGFDPTAKDRFAVVIAEFAAEGKAIVVATHDVEFAALAVHRVVVVAEGEVVADGPAADVLVASPSFAPQVAKILAPLPWLTVGQLVAAGALEKTPS